MISLKIKSIADPSSEYIKDQLIKMFPDTSLKRWKRTKRNKQGILIVREFEHGDKKVSVVYNSVERELEITELADVPQHFLALSQLLDRNDFDEDDVEEDYSSYTGNIGIFTEEDSFNDFEQSGEFSFYLGVEEIQHKEVHISDHMSMYHWLQETLKIWIKENDVDLEIGAAENYHILIPGHKSKIRLKALIDDMITVIRTALPPTISLNEHEI